MNKRRLGERGHNTGNQRAAVGADARHGQAAMPRLPLLVRRTCEQPGAALPGLRGQAAAWAPAVTRAEIIAELAASSPHLRQADAELIVATIFEQITAALVRGERVELRGFGAFTVKQRPARIGRNPRTGKVVAVEEKTRPYFKTGTEMLRRLNRGSRPASEHPP
jgi:integration host factor subunit beta